MSEWLKGFKERGAREGKALIRDDLVGVDEWKGSKVKAALGGGRLFIAPLRSVGGIITRSIVNVGTLAAGAFWRDRAEPLPTESQDLGERFRVAQEFYGQSDQDVLARQKGTHSWFLLYMAATFAMLAIGIASWSSYATGLPTIIDCLGRFAAVPALLSLAARAAFHNWQLRTRSLGSFAAWLRSPGDWWTEPPDGSGGSLTPALPAAAVLALGGAVAASIGLTPVQAVAQGAADGAAAAASAGSAVTALFGTPGPKDLWYKLLTMVFPGVGSLGGTVTPIHNGIYAGFAGMISVLMAVSAAMMSYQIVLGCAATAHEGKLLGQRWHSMFAPIRVVYGVACLAPAVKGLCLLQVLVVYMAVASGQIGNVIWSGFVDNLDAGKISEPRLEGTIQTVRDVLTIEVCHAGNRIINSGSTIPDPVMRVDPISVGGTVRSFGQTIWHAVATTIDSSWTAGGTTGVGDERVTWDYGPCGKITNTYEASGSSSAFVGEMDASRKAAFENLRSEIRPVAERIARASYPRAGGGNWSDADASGFMSSVVSAKDNYDQAMLAAAQSYANATNNAGLSQFQTAAKEAGWVSAGPYYMALGRMSSQVLSYIDRAPKIEFALTAEGATPRYDSLKALMWAEQGGSSNGGAEGALRRLATTWDAALTNPNYQLNADAARAGKFNNYDSINGALSYLGSADSILSQTVLSMATLVPGKGTALLEMVRFGNHILNAAWGLLLIMFLTPTAQLVAEGAKTIGSSMIGKLIPSGIRQLSSGFTYFFGLIAMGLLLVGIFHAFILPMLPYVYFFFAIMGLLILVVEGVIAAPIWAFMHIRMDGQEFMDGPQKAGYMIVFNLLFRIPLTLFGLFFSILVFEAMVWLLWATLVPAMVGGTADSTFGFLGLVTYFIMITVINYQIATRSFHMITQVPDRVARWFGAQADGGDEHNSIRAVGALIQQSTNQGLQAGSGAAKSAVGAAKMLGQREVAERQAQTQERIAKALEGGGAEGQSGQGVSKGPQPRKSGDPD